jgi:3-hydroxyacyl-[acyl-carrier-protein] dehydratase
MKMNVEEIMRILPHRYPFLMIDRVTEFEAGNYVKGFKNITINEQVFNGHFPNKPIFPGVLILESLAQLGGLLFMKGTCEGDINQSDLVYICKIKEVKFIKFAIPGDRLEMCCEFVGEFGNFLTVKATAKVDENVICKTEITYAKSVSK